MWCQEKKHVMYCIDYLFQFRVYIWGGTERTSLQRRWWGMEQKGEVCMQLQRRLVVIGSIDQNLLWTQEREILHLCQLLGHMERCLEPLTLTTPFYLVVVGVFFVCLQSQLHFALVLSHLICCWLPSILLCPPPSPCGCGSRRSAVPGLLLLHRTQKENEDEEEEDQVYCTDPTRDVRR